MDPLGRQLMGVFCSHLALSAVIKLYNSHQRPAYEGLICCLAGVQMVIFENPIVPSLTLTTILQQVNIGFPNQKESSPTQPPFFKGELSVFK